MYGPAFLGTAAADLFTVPAATSAIVKYLHVVKPGKTPCILVLSIGADAAGTRIYPTTYIIEDTITPIFVYFPLATGEKMQGYAIGINGASAVNAIGLTVTGDYFI